MNLKGVRRKLSERTIMGFVSHDSLVFLIWHVWFEWNEWFISHIGHVRHVFLVWQILLMRKDMGDLFDDQVTMVYEKRGKMNIYDIKLRWSEKDQRYIAEVPELPGCFADGKTPEEAVRNAEVVIAEWVETAKMCGREIPENVGFRDDKDSDMRKLIQRLSKVEDAYYGFICAVLTYVKNNPEKRYPIVERYLTEHPWALSSDVISFISDQDDFYDDAAD